MTNTFFFRMYGTRIADQMLGKNNKNLSPFKELKNHTFTIDLKVKNEEWLNKEFWRQLLIVFFLLFVLLLLRRKLVFQSFFICIIKIETSTFRMPTIPNVPWIEPNQKKKTLQKWILINKLWHMESQEENMKWIF